MWLGTALTPAGCAGPGSAHETPCLMTCVVASYFGKTGTAFIQTHAQVIIVVT